MSNSVRPHRRQPTRHPCPWDSPGKNTRVGCHFLLQCVKVKVKVKLCLTFHDPMDCSLPGSSVHRIFQARVLEWVAIAFSHVPLGLFNLLLNIKSIYPVSFVVGPVDFLSPFPLLKRFSHCKTKALAFQMTASAESFKSLFQN